MKTTRKPRMTMLWRGLGSASHVTLLGSLHALSAPPPEWALAPARTHERIVLEALPPSREEMERSNGETITGRWPDTARDFTRATRLANIDFDQLNRAWPAWAAINLASHTLGERWSRGPEAEVSRILSQRGLAPIYLEGTADFQRLFCYSIPLVEQVRFLQHTMRGLAHGPVRVARAEVEWRKGRLDALGATLELDTPPPDAREVLRHLFEERNKLWTPRLEAFIREAASVGNRLFVVVGAGHLYGPSNLLSLLGKSGLFFEQLPDEPQEAGA